MRTQIELHPAHMPALEDQRACFGWHRPQDVACAACIVESWCEERRAKRLEEFSTDWSRQQRIGAESQLIQITVASICLHCQKLVRPGEGKARHVRGKGVYHAECVDMAFPGR